jgi:glycosyltransferase involved in cell wall biosynthesis
MAPALAARGHDVHVLSCVAGQASDDTRRDGVHLHRRGVRRILPVIRRRLPSTAFRIEGAVSCYLEFRSLGLEVDVVEAPDWMAEGLAFALARTRPLVAHLHTPLVLVGRHNPGSFRWSRDGRLAASLERLAVRPADVVTSPSHLLARDLARDGWLGHLEPRIIRYPMDMDMWTSLPPVDASPPRVLAVGRLEARKAPEILVRAAASLSAEVPELDVVFIGRSELRDGGSYKDWLATLVRRLGAPCRFVDEVPRHELPRWYGSARAAVLASRYDNFPYSGLEAMAAGRPLVCTETTGTAELLAGTAAGIAVAPDDPGALAAALRPYLVDPERAGRAGREARSVVKDHCAPDRIAQAREACYEEAIGRWRRRPGGRWRSWMPGSGPVPEI